MRAVAALAASLLVVAGASAQQAAPPLRAPARAVVVGDDGRILELTAARGSGVVAPSGGGEPWGAVVLLDQLGLGRGYLGVQLVALTEQLRARFGVPPGEGALVSDVVAGSPAERADLRAGDVITGVGSQPVRRTGDVALLVSERDGETVELEIYRAGTPQPLTVAVAERRRPLVKIGREGDAVLLQWIGGGGPLRFDAEAARFFVDDALEGLGFYFESDEWRQRTEGTPATHAARDGSELDAEQIQLRIEALRREILELRGRLERLAPEPP
ncbi:MAG TPA: PDZ domain-containing protein [Thermoanaerobaculia bacterium]|nr:PDZ domain-containing protein [Thermoanaerobaculia bacterium]